MATAASSIKRTVKHLGDTITWELADVYLQGVQSSREAAVRFACHKVELVKKSETFGEIFRNQEYSLDEDGIKYLFLEEVDSATLGKLLQFIYYGKLPDRDLDGKLLEASVHFKLKGLTELCLNLIPTLFTEDNVCSSLMIAYKLDISELKKSSFEYIWDNLDDMAGRSDFQALLQEYPTLMTDILIMSKKLCNGLQDRVEDIEGFADGLEGRFKGFVTETLERKLPHAPNFHPYTTSGPNKDDGEPFTIGTFPPKAGDQHLSLPVALPKKAKKVKILVSYYHNVSSGQGGSFTKLWTNIAGKKYQRWIHGYRINSYDYGFQGSELTFPIQENDRNIYTNLNVISGYYPNFTIYLVGYWI